MSNSNLTTICVFFLKDELDNHIKSYLFGAAQTMIRLDSKYMYGDDESLDLYYTVMTDFKYEVFGSFSGYLFEAAITVNFTIIKVRFIVKPLRETEFTLNVEITTAEEMLSKLSLN